MEYVGIIFGNVLNLLQIPFNILGYELTFWQVFVYIGVAGVILDFVMEAFFDD